MTGRWNRLLPRAASVLLIGLVAVGLSAQKTSGAAVRPRGESTALAASTAVGALFTTSDGRIGHHFCTASVVASFHGNVLITAAHCLAGISFTAPDGVVFAPGYRDGRFPLGVWNVTSAFTTTKWTASRDPNDDVAFLIANSPGRPPVQLVAGADVLGLDVSLPARIEAIGYPDTASRPVACSALALDVHPEGLRQLTFACPGFTDGTSGGPLLSDINPATGRGTLIGVIGGYQQGGITAAVSYSARFAQNVAALFQLATSPTRDPGHRNDPA
ncbi:MAG: trypsin-like serine peptidase [Streptosporangiaceae bacterium]